MRLNNFAPLYYENRRGRPAVMLVNELVPGKNVTVEVHEKGKSQWAT